MDKCTHVQNENSFCTVVCIVNKVVENKSKQLSLICDAFTTFCFIVEQSFHNNNLSVSNTDMNNFYL